MKITEKLLEDHGWIFSPALSILVSEHELDHGEWDIEIQAYQNVDKKSDGGVWDLQTDVMYESYNTFAVMIAANPEFASAQDWIDGDRVEFL